jgi:hypothetical protein
MPFEDSIAKLAVDISDTFAKEVHCIIDKIVLEENDFVSRELEISKVTAFAVCFAVIRSNLALTQAKDAWDAAVSTTWIQAVRGDGTTSNDKQTFSRTQTAARKNIWPRSQSNHRADSSGTVFSRSSNRNAVAATPDIAAKPAVHTRGMTPENRV